MNPPSEWSFAGILVPPLLLAAVLGIVVAAIVSRIVGGSRIVRFVWHPWLAFTGLAVLFTALIALFFIRAA